MTTVAGTVAKHYALIFVLLWTKLCNAIGIYNGTLTTIHDYPSQVCITYVKRNGLSDQLCGGTIINPWHVLTSCHCFESSEDAFNPSELVVAGDSRWEDKTRSTNRQKRSIQRLIIHPGCKYRGSNHVDVAICRVNESFALTRSNLKTIPFAKRIPPIGTICAIVGWGQDESGSKSQELKKAVTRISPYHKCGSYYFDTEKFICASSPSGHQTPCYGDCGGPLICNNELVGILEGGYGICGNKMYGNYYTFVSEHTDWIRSVSSWTDRSVPKRNWVLPSDSTKLKAESLFYFIIVYNFFQLN